ncbi:YggT family protein [Geothermobacter hydrogeniphilus]|uniref:YggT family protein n=1 Tax=Geothermobacter hydrogeniphilus TaxID=1969733 RepID=A0A1X0XMZ6_9BACT|nr:YggT family protein [Geothermobacter hydrogeniphilus]ORJ54266.1 YggT family protein [Geothermobacter hydrogeniphilus]
MGIIFESLISIVNLVFQIYLFIVIGRALISWVNPDPYNPIVRFLHNATEPVLYRIRRLIPLQFGGFDFSPIILMLALEVGRKLVVGLIVMLAGSMGAW